MDQPTEEVEAAERPRKAAAAGLGGPPRAREAGGVAGAEGPYAERSTGRRNLGKDRPERAAAIERGLRWLIEHQDEAGSWAAADGGNPIAVTSLALLAMLGEGSTLRRGQYKAPTS